MHQNIFFHECLGAWHQESPSIHIEPNHWQEWWQSAVAPELIESNVHSLARTNPYNYLCYSDSLERTNTGRLVSHLLRQYAHTEHGGWWCSGLDPLNNWQKMSWGCFKPDRPRFNFESGKVIKYEHPPKTPTRAFFLNLPDRLWLEIAIRYGVPAACTNPQLDSIVNEPTKTEFKNSYEFWQWVLEHPEIPIILVEGAKKAGSLLSLGYAAIALPGIYNGRRVIRDGFGKVWAESLIPDLDLFATAGRRFYFCFDHDTKPKTVKNVNLAILKTGRLLEQKGCEVQVITLPGPEKGVDDFIVAQGTEAFNQVYANARSFHGWQWYIRKQAELTYTPQLRLNTRELNPEQLLATQCQSGEQLNILRSLLPNQQQSELGGIIVIASGKGTGKTKLISQMLQNTSKALAVGHRIALMRNLCSRMKLDYKGDIDKVNGNFITDSAYTLRLGLCIDSLLSINPEKFTGCTLVIDEFMQVFNHLLTSSTCNKDGKRAALLARLQWLMRVASWVIVADADASDIGIDYIRSLRGATSPVYLIRNDYTPQGYPVRFIEAAKDDAIIAELLADIRAGRKVFVATDAKSNSIVLEKLINLPVDALEPGKKANIVLINSDTSGGEYEIDFIRNINERVSSADVVIATPSMATGVSIEVEHFDKVYGLFYGTVTDADASQALSRVRANIPRVVWCARTGKNFSKVGKSVYPNQLKTTLKTRWEAEISVIRTSLNPDMIPNVEAFNWDNNPHLDLWAKLTAKTNASMWNLRANLLERLRYEGNTVEVVRLYNHAEIKNALAQAKDAVKTEYYQGVSKAKLLTPKEMVDKEQQEFIKLEDKLAIEKTYLADFYCVEDVTPSLVAFDNGGKRRGQIVELEALLYGASESIQRDINALERQFKWGQGVLPFDHPCYELRRFAREVLGLGQFLVPGKEWSNADLEPLGARARASRHQIKLFFGFTIPDNPEQANNIWIFRQMMNPLGVKTLSRRSSREQVRTVWIEPQKWSEILLILERRFAKRAEQADNSDSIESGLATPVVAENYVVTPPDINKLEGVTTKPEFQTQEKLTLTNQDLQTGVDILGVITQTEAVEELDIFDDWTQQQKRQLWQIVPQWLKAKIHSLIDGLRGCAMVAHHRVS